MRSANTIGWLNKIEVDVVTIEGCPRFEQFYWQLVTSNTQHLLTLPTTVTPEWRWIWDRLWWQRHSPLDQSDFEQWLSATVQVPLAPALIVMWLAASVLSLHLRFGLLHALYCAADWPGGHWGLGAGVAGSFTSTSGSATSSDRMRLGCGCGMVGPGNSDWANIALGVVDCAAVCGDASRD